MLDVSTKKSANAKGKSPPVLKSLMNNPRLLFIAFISSIGGLLFGYDQGVISSIQEMPAFQARFPMTSTENGFVVSILELGAWTGAYFIGALADRISRKYSILVALGIFLIGSSIQSAAQEVIHLLVGRFIGGFGIGALSVIGPLYQSELSPPEIRGSIVTFYILSVIIGVAIAFWTDYGCAMLVGDISWRLPLILQLVYGVIMLGGIMFLPFSPRWLMHVGREKEAMQVLKRLRQTDDVEDEWKDIKVMTMFEHQMEEQQFIEAMGTEATARPSNKWIACKLSCRREIIRYANVLRQGMWKRVMIGATLMFFQQFVGINAIIYYAPAIVASLGQSGNSTKLLATGVIGIIMIFGCLAAVFSIERLGRRPMLLGGSVGIASAMIVIGSLSSLYAQTWPEHLDAGWACIAMIYFYVLLCNFIIGFITPSMLQSSPAALYFMFGGFGVLSFFFVFFFVPETSNKSLEEIDRELGSNTADEDEIVISQIRNQVEQLEVATVGIKA
ncbi:hypothetical protein BC940DRAFT_370385 [Gongronella butleri]|nr:hypothetical protein BC940DRAFT_370385 [Gongronella butleri]